MKVTVQFSDLVVAFPAPTLLAGSPFEVRSGNGRLVVRTPKVREYGYNCASH
jgi:hypothetical protein